jgi:DNA (cytosine-5)-methyltransferase 1
MEADVNASPTRVTAIDLFCGAGGLSYGLKTGGVSVIAGVDVDPACEYPFESNVDAAFLQRDVRDLTADQLNALWGDAEIRALVGCAPCRPFSPYRRGVDTSSEEDWPLLSEFGRLVRESRPELVTMENVPRIQSSDVFLEFVEVLRKAGYHVAWRTCPGPEYGLGQSRRRLVLLASLLGPIEVPSGTFGPDRQRTVRDLIGGLPPIQAGKVSTKDRLHKSRSLSELNLLRIKASTPGGTWELWPEELRASCHSKRSGATFRNVYARMEWDKPAPTITTLAYNFGTGRFGHPEQDRAISLREAAILQGFPRRYRFVKPREPVRFATLGRLIGNAVPPPIAKAVGRALAKHAKSAAPA